MKNNNKAKNLPEWVRELKKMYCSRLVKLQLDRVMEMAGTPVEEAALAALAKELLRVPVRVSNTRRKYGSRIRAVSASEETLTEWVEEHYADISQADGKIILKIDRRQSSEQ